MNKYLKDYLEHYRLDLQYFSKKLIKTAAYVRVSHEEQKKHHHDGENVGIFVTHNIRLFLLFILLLIIIPIYKIVNCEKTLSNLQIYNFSAEQRTKKATSTCAEATFFVFRNSFGYFFATES